MRNPLQCPSCGSDWLHHDRVTAYVRAEDAKARVHSVVFNGGANVPTALPGNPSARREGIVVEGWCEGCPARWHLTIAQHKGQTFVELREM